MPGYLHVRPERRSGLVVLRVTGELDMITARDLAGRVAAAIGNSAHPDLSGLSFTDLAGARALDAVIRAIPAGRLAEVRSCQPQVGRVLELLGLSLGLGLAGSATREPSLMDADALESQTRELVYRVSQARLHASVAKYDASSVIAALTDTGRRVERTRHRSIRTRQQGRRLRASIHATRVQARRPTASARA
jgi:anti-anti-sigma regulatory factor